MAERIGRYQVYERIASGGMASVHLARLSGPHGFGRVLAVKRLRDVQADSELPLMLLEEARIASRIRSSFVVPTIDVVSEGDELLLVMEYVLGESLAGLIAKANQANAPPIDVTVAAGIAVNMLTGLHAAHELTSDEGEPLHLVHRDVSPQNLLVGADGIARVLDFGIAKAMGRAQTTREGQIKGKLAYMSPEQLLGKDVDRRTDIFAASIVFWELLTRTRLFGGVDQQTTIARLLNLEIPPPSRCRQDLDPTVDEIVMKGLSRDRDQRFPTALAMAQELDSRLPIATSTRVSAWVESLMFDELALRRLRVEEIEAGSADSFGETARAANDLERTAATVTAAADDAVHPPDVDDAVHPRRKRRLLRPLGIALVAIAGIGWLVASARARDLGSRASDLSQDQRDIAPNGSSSTTASAYAATSEPPVLVNPSASVVSAPVGSTPPLKGPKRTSPARPKTDCRQAFFFDEEGRKRYRRECLSP